MNMEIFNLDELEGKEVAFIVGNRNIDSLDIRKKAKSIAINGLLCPLVIVDGKRVINEGLELISGDTLMPIAKSNANKYVAVIEGQHRYMAIQRLRKQDRENAYKREKLIEEWDKTKKKKGIKPEPYKNIAPALIPAIYPLNDKLSIRATLFEINNTAKTWSKRNYVASAYMLSKEDILFLFLLHKTNEKYSLSTLSQYLTFGRGLTSNKLAQYIKGAEDLGYSDEEKKTMIDRAKKILKVAKDAGFSDKFLMKRYLPEYIGKKFITNGIAIDKVLEDISLSGKQEGLISAIEAECNVENFHNVLSKMNAK